MSDDELFQRLCQAQIEGRATDSERAELQEILRRSDTARRSYVEQMRIHAMLTWQHGRSQATLAEVLLPAKVVKGPWRRWVLMAAAAVLLLAGLTTWWLADEFRGGVELEVLAATEVPFHAGERVTCRRLEVARGSLIFRLGSGAVVEVTGGTQLELLTPMHLRVLTGNVTADISHGTKGFEIETPQARVVDLGTRFGVSAGDGQGTDIAVFEGEVEVYGRNAQKGFQSPKIVLTEGEAIRLPTIAVSKRLSMIWLGKDAQSLARGNASALVGEIRDNVQEAEFRRYYGLIRGGMGEGARVYTTGNSRRWRAMPGRAFPEELVGADVICTFSTDRRVPDLKIQLRVNRPCDLFVMADTRGPAPAWLAESFEATGLELRSGPWIPRGTLPEATPAYAADESTYIPYAVWRKRISAPGTIDLGSPIGEPGTSRHVMYGLAVKAVP